VRWLIYILFWGLILYLIASKYVGGHSADHAVKGIFGSGWHYVTDVWDATIGQAFKHRHGHVNINFTGLHGHFRHHHHHHRSHRRR
jgi:hypothetical protein